MESKKVDNTRIVDNQQKKHPILVNDFSGRCGFLKSTDLKEKKNNTTSKSSDSVDWNKETKYIKDKDSIVSTPSEIAKYSNFEYEEEWDIGGIPELLNDLDADIEKSLKVHNFDGDKNLASYKKDILKPIPIKLNEKEKKCNSQRIKKTSPDLLSTDIHILSHDILPISESTTASISKSVNSNAVSNSPLSSTSTFAGFSKGGHLISTTSSTHYILTHRKNLDSSNETVSCKSKIETLKHLETKGCTAIMSLQAGSNSNTSSTASGGGTSNTSSGQSGSCSGNTIKSNNKMSIDHQATLDKGLKMKIKRTKPGSKSSEAKHEIVKATEQQQNGQLGTGAVACSTNQDEITCSVSAANLASSSSTQGSNNAMGNSNLQASGNLIGGSKKNVGNISSQTSNNVALNNNSGNNALSCVAGMSNSTSQSIGQGTKRGSSGHRRDKAKDKSSHSNRTGVGTEKNSLITEKESTEKSTCQCSGADSNTLCSSNTCIRRTECSTITQRLSNTNTSGSNAAVPPGVFTPSADTPNAAVSATKLLADTTGVSSTLVVTQSSPNCGSANAPGPPSKEVSSGIANIKISSHIAAQLAAAAASNNSTSGSSVSTLPHTDMKLSPSNVTNQMAKQLAPGTISATVHHTLAVPVATSTNILSGTIITPSQQCTGNSTSSVSPDDSSASPPAKRAKHMDCNTTELAANMNNKEMVDICIGTSVGTITEPDCLGPCEPGTSVTLEGIVWHETEGGVLVVNVTWRGKTYVGTLLDCTRHDWAPPRFCDSPTEDLDSRTPKGRGKRGRAPITPDLSNFTETRSSIYFSHSHVHSKLRNGSTKGGRATSRTSSTSAIEKTNSGSSLSSGNGGSTPSTSPTAFLPPRSEKRKSKDGSPSPVRGDNESMNTNMVNASGIPISAIGGGLATQPQSLINPVTGLNVQISTKKCKTSPSCAISPVLLECPEQDCSKKYKHANGLRYHQSYAHGSATLLDEDSMAENEEPLLTPLPSPLSSALTPSSTTPNPSDVVSNTQNTASSKPSTLQVSDGSIANVKKSEQDVSSSEIDQTETSSQAPGETQSLPCDNLLSPTEKRTNNTISTATVTSTVGCTTTGTSHSGQQKQFVDIVGNKLNINPLLLLESSNQPTQQSPAGKSGILRFGQPEGDEKMDSSCVISEHSPNNKHQTEEQLYQTSSLESEQNSLRPLTPKNDINTSLQQISNTESYSLSDETAEKASQQPPIQESVPNSNQTASNFVAKPKKIRKTPPPSDYDSKEINSCSVPSREDVQSPAYSDISDDSTPVNDQEVIDKQQISKNSDIIKKVQDIGLSSVSVCSAGNQNNMTSTLGGYGVYQFYQQQQFMVPPSIEQQQSSKNNISPNSGQSVIPSSGAQQQIASELNSKKEPPLDLITKGNLSQQHSIQQTQDLSKDSSRQLSVATSHGSNDITSISSMGSTGALASASSKPVSHFYAFNYMSPNYSFNVEPNYGPVPINATEDTTKMNKNSGILSPNDQQQQPPVMYNEDRSKDESAKTVHQQIIANKAVKTEPLLKTENIKQETTNTSSSQIPQQHIPLQSKDLQGIGVYSNMYQRHPLTLVPQPLSREEELRRYYIFSDQQRRQNNSTQSVINHQGQGSSIQSGHQQFKDDVGSLQQTSQNHHQHLIKIKPNASLNMMSTSGKSAVTKESPKHKQEDEIKVIKQEGQKPTMETQGPPPPPTSQYFLHPSYIASTPFGFDPNHSMYRNVLMPATSPYNTPPYHLSMPRYHAPEDLSRNTGTKALDALHHAASQYYTNHKIHELSERALKSPNSSSSNSASGAIKVSVSSPNIGTTQLSNISANIVGHHSSLNQPSGATQLPHNLTSQTIGGTISNKQDITGQKPLGTGNAVHGTSLNEPQKPQTSGNSSIGSTAATGIPSSSVGNVTGGSTTDSRSPPPQRHVHTHHHTHVGLGYPMYPAPYGAAVLASQQAAAVAVINPFPPGPNK